MEDRIIYIGDSPNDDPLFKVLKYSAAVNNIVNFLENMESYPTYRASQNSGKGFLEIVNTILEKREY